jgi:hypothetical protein
MILGEELGRGRDASCTLLNTVMCFPEVIISVDIGQNSRVVRGTSFGKQIKKILLIWMDHIGRNSP